MAMPSLTGLFLRGGFYYGISGVAPKEVLSQLAGEVPFPDNGRDRLLTALLEREELMSTAAGNGIALPHPRNPVINRETEQFAALAFPEKPLDWGALDGIPVHSIILLVSASPRLHLDALRRISFFCHDAEFCLLLRERAQPGAVLSYMEKAETGWS